MDIKSLKWIQGPKLPLGISASSCVALPPTSDFSCVLIGGMTEKGIPSSKVYGLNGSLNEWTLLGEIKTGISDHITIPLS